MSLQRLQGKSALITGGGSGIGRATAHRFAQEGAAALLLFDRDQDALRRVADELRSYDLTVVPYVGDVVDIDACRDATEQAQATTGQLDILVSNAAADSSASFLELEVDEWDRLMAINLRASFVLGQLAARAMVKSGKGGSILYTASISGMGASLDDAHYGASKAGVINLTQTMAIELVTHKIRVNCVSPGPLDTPLSRALLGSDEAMERARESWPMVPMNRLGKPEEIAATYAFLASDDGGYITGQNLVVDGGLLANVYVIPDELFGS